MIRPLLVLPHPALSRTATPVGALDEAALALAVDLVDTMRAASHSVGVAAPQIGVSRRGFCVDVSGHPKARSCHGEIVLFDPVVLDAEGVETGREGCMSVPDLTGDVPRATRLVVGGVGPDGHHVVVEADAFEARALAHELDHLDGLLFLDRVAADDRVFQRRVYR